MLSSTAGTRNGTSDNTINNSKNESVTNEHFGAASTTTNTNNNNSMSINTRQFGTGRGSSEPLLSNAELETKGKELQSKSLLLSAALTQKLATSQSGQNLLHMGTSLSSTLPPDLHTLLQNLHPLASSCEATEKCIATELERTVATETRLVQQLERERVATKAAQTLTDLMAAEDIVQRNSRRLRSKENYHQQHDSLADESVTGIAGKCMALRCFAFIRFRLEVLMHSFVALLVVVVDDDGDHCFYSLLTTVLHRGRTGSCRSIGTGRDCFGHIAR